MSTKYVKDYLLFDTQDCLFIHDGIFVQKHFLLKYVKHNTIWMPKSFKSFKSLNLYL